MLWCKKYDISKWNVAELRYNQKTEILKYEYLKIILKYSTQVNVLSNFSTTINGQAT